MKKTFSKQYVLNNKGCYETNQAESLPFENDQITLEKLFEVLPIKDFCWWVAKKCELTKLQNQLFALNSASSVLYIYEKRYPNDNRVKECIEATRQYSEGKISIEDLREKRAAADAYAADAYAYAYAYAAAAAAAAAAYAADADDAAYAAAAAAAAAAAYADDAAYAAFKESVRIFVFETLKTNA